MDYFLPHFFPLYSTHFHYCPFRVGWHLSKKFRERKKRSNGENSGIMNQCSLWRDYPINKISREMKSSPVQWFLLLHHHHLLHHLSLLFIRISFFFHPFITVYILLCSPHPWFPSSFIFFSFPRPTKENSSRSNSFLPSRYQEYTLSSSNFFLPYYCCCLLKNASFLFDSSTDFFFIIIILSSITYLFLPSLYDSARKRVKRVKNEMGRINEPFSLSSLFLLD